MKKDKKILPLMLTTLVTMGLAVVTAQAQNYLNTFDNSGSIVGRFDYGSATSMSADSWSSLDAQNNASSGSELLTYTLNTAADGTAVAAETMDLFYPGRDYTDLSFDMMVGPNSATDNYGGYAYFSVATRLTDSYNYNTVLQGELGESYGISLTPGTWVHIDIPLSSGPSGTGTALRALTFQEYSDSGRNVNGNVYIYLDNLSLSAVPEPSSIALVGLGIAGLLCIRRYRTAKG